MGGVNGFERWVARALAAGVTCLALAGTASAAEIYKWVDENGTTHYSDSRPSGVKWQILTDSKVSVIPASRIGAEAARAAERMRLPASPGVDIQTQEEAQVRSQRREQLMKDCQRNNGVDCEREVDTQLRAEAIQEGRGVIRTVPPPVRVSPSAPAASSSAPSPSRSELR